MSGNVFLFFNGKLNFLVEEQKSVPEQRTFPFLIPKHLFFFHLETFSFFINAS